MTVRISVKRALIHCALTLVGMWVGAYAGTQLDDVFTGEATIASVGLIFGGWAGSMFGGSGWADTVSSFRQWSWAAGPMVLLSISAGTIAVVSIADSATFLAGFLIGIAIMAYLLARETRYRFIFAALLLGAFTGAAVSAAGGIAAIEQVLSILRDRGFAAVIESGQSEGLRHRYLGRDREDLFIGTVFLGYVFVSAAMMFAFIGLGIAGVCFKVFDKKVRRKRKREGIGRGD